MTWETFLFIPFAFAAFGTSSYRMLILYRLLRASKGRDPRWGEILERLKTVFINVIGQKAVLQNPGIGIAHALIFWGFIFITIGTLEQFATTLYSPIHFDIIGEGPYSALVFVQDIFTLAVLGAVLFAAYRRMILRPPHLNQSRDANNILLLTAALMVSILLMNAFTILGKSPWYQEAMPVSQAVAALLSLSPLSQESYSIFATLFKWVHMGIVMGFAVYIPGSKHLHIIAAGPNTFFRTLKREKGMRPIDFENTQIEQYGAAKVTDLTWKDTLDLYSCTECGRCQEVCPAWNTKKPLSPKNLITDLKYNLHNNKVAILKGTDQVSHVIDQNVTEDIIWACTSCRACEVACPVFIEHTDKIYDIRRNLVMMEARFPAEVQNVFKNMETNATPWAFSSADRANWAEGLSVPTMAEDATVDLLLWVGCAGSYDDRNKKVLRAFVSLLKKAKVKFAILGKEEQCTGDPARRIGNEYLYQTLAKANIETLNRYNVKSVVTSCPHCFNTIKNEYPFFGGTYEVFHHSQYIAKLIASGRLKPTKSIEETITFHDSCYLGRWNGEFEAPRTILKTIPSVRLTEMQSSQEKGLCCGAGGGRMWMEEKIGTRINIKRTEQAIATKAGIVASACPFCMTMMTDGMKAKEMSGRVKVLDLAELLDQAIP